MRYPLGGDSPPPFCRRMPPSSSRLVATTFPAGPRATSPTELVNTRLEGTLRIFLAGEDLKPVTSRIVQTTYDGRPRPSKWLPLRYDGCERPSYIRLGPTLILKRDKALGVPLTVIRWQRAGADPREKDCAAELAFPVAAFIMGLVYSLLSKADSLRNACVWPATAINAATGDTVAALGQ